MQRHCDFLVIKDKVDPRARYSCRLNAFRNLHFCALLEPAALIFAVVRDRIHYEKTRMHVHCAWYRVRNCIKNFIL